MSRTFSFHGMQITTYKATMSWMAHVTGNPSLWETGITEAEAIGKLIISLSS